MSGGSGGSGGGGDVRGDGDVHGAGPEAPHTPGCQAGLRPAPSPARAELRVLGAVDGDGSGETGGF